jgi:hypothetical protein
MGPPANVANEIADLISGSLAVGAPVPGGRPNAEPGGGRAAVPRSGAALIYVRINSATRRLGWREVPW